MTVKSSPRWVDAYPKQKLARDERSRLVSVVGSFSGFRFWLSASELTGLKEVAEVFRLLFHESPSEATGVVVVEFGAGHLCVGVDG